MGEDRARVEEAEGMSNPDSPLGLPGRLGQRPQQAAEHGAHVVAPVEAELHLSQVAEGILGELDNAVGPGERGLDVADEGVDGLELLGEYAALAAARDLAVVDSASARGDLEAIQAIHLRQELVLARQVQTQVGLLPAWPHRCSLTLRK
jgi:hypothetical protein